MSAESTLYAALSGWAGLTSLVSARIYPDEVPLGVALPAVAWLRFTNSTRRFTERSRPGNTKALMDIATAVAETDKRQKPSQIRSSTPRAWPARTTSQTEACSAIRTRTSTP